jgi:hypothetical protein
MNPNQNDLGQKATFGRRGVTVETGTTAVTGSFYAVQVLTDAVFTTFTEEGAEGDAMTSITLPAGTTIFGRITAVTASSGAFRAYHA